MLQFPMNTGTQILEFDSFTDFKQWKELEEERTNTSYVRDDHVYHVKSTTEGKVHSINSKQQTGIQRTAYNV